MKLRSRLASLSLLGFLSLNAPQLSGATMEVLIGPPSLGQGGSNPVSIPPFNPLDWQVAYVNDEAREMVFSIVPGFFYGQRFYLKQVYASLGGGILLTSGGLGAGVHQAIGFHSEEIIGKMRLQIEYRQIIGIANYGPQFPYSIRIGMSYAF